MEFTCKQRGNPPYTAACKQLCPGIAAACGLCTQRYMDEIIRVKKQRNDLRRRLQQEHGKTNREKIPGGVYTSLQSWKNRFETTNILYHRNLQFVEMLIRELDTPSVFPDGRCYKAAFDQLKEIVEDFLTKYKKYNI